MYYHKKIKDKASNNASYTKIILRFRETFLLLSSPAKLGQM